MPRHDPRNRGLPSCYECGKDIFPNRKSAKERITELRTQQPGQHTEGSFRVYAGCSGGYHVGHVSNAVRGANLNDPRLRFI